MLIASVKSENFFENSRRIDPRLYINDAVKYYNLLKHQRQKISFIEDESSDCYWGNVFARIFVSNEKNGIKYITASEMVKSELTSQKFLQKKQANNYPELILDKDWILVSCSGTIGNCVYTDSRYIGTHGSQNLIRLHPRKKWIYPGVLYAFLASKFGQAVLSHTKYGSVVQHINPEHVKAIPIPILSETLQLKIHALIIEAARLREEADAEDKCALNKMKSYVGLRDITQDDYNYFGPRTSQRDVSVFCKKRSAINYLSINAFNYSKRTADFRSYLRATCQCVTLQETLDSNGIFSTGSFPRLEYDSPASLLLINQKDIFNSKLTGKKIARRGVKTNNLVKYGEVIIAGVGTLGESETFCRALFANETLADQLISGEFLRMNTNSEFPSGYLYTWLHSEYGFRFIRSTQSGTKLCRPIPKLLLQIPVPVLPFAQMQEIHDIVISSQTHRHLAAEKENEAIRLIEEEIEKWQR